MALEGVDVHTERQRNIGRVSGKKKNVKAAVVLEEHIIVHDLLVYANAFANCIGLLYGLNIDYPQGMKYISKLTQKSFHGHLQWQLFS